MPSIEEIWECLDSSAEVDEYPATLSYARAAMLAVLERCAREAWGSGFHDTYHEIRGEIEALGKEFQGQEEAPSVIPATGREV